MKATVIDIPADRITDWESFHSVFQQQLGFPVFYGRDMNAWIDCLSDADEETGMITRPVEKGEHLALRINGAADFANRCPEQYAALIECAAFVNDRRAEAGKASVLTLLLDPMPSSPA
ncbi:barstar family protein [Brevundimonas sp.]